MARTTSVEQEARILVCHDAHGSTVEQALLDFPGPMDRMCDRGVLEAAVRLTRQPVQIFIAWLDRLVSDPAVRPLDADLEVTWPKHPDPEDVALVLAMVDDPRCWYYEARVALLLAERVVDSETVTTDLVDGLLALRRRLEDDRLHSSEFFRSKILPWTLRLIARTSPSEVVDLAFVDPHDTWAPTVADAVNAAADPVGVARAFVHLSSPRGSRPSKAWWMTTAELFERNSDLTIVVEQLLGEIVTADATPRSEDRDGWDVPDPYLLAPANELVARGMIWGIRNAGMSTARIRLIAQVLLRSAAMVWVPPAHRMLCPKLASAATDTLIAFDHDEARRELEDLLDEIRNPTLIRRIGAHLGVEVDDVVSAFRRRGPLPRPDR